MQLPSFESDALVSYTGALVEYGFKLNEEVKVALFPHLQILGLFSFFTELPKERLLLIYPLLCHVFCHVGWNALSFHVGHSDPIRPFFQQSKNLEYFGRALKLADSEGERGVWGRDANHRHPLQQQQDQSVHSLELCLHTVSGDQRTVPEGSRESSRRAKSIRVVRVHHQLLLRAL